MGKENNKRAREKKRFAEAFEHPHFLIFAEKIALKSIGKSAEGLFRYENDLAALQFALAKGSDEEELQGFIDFFTEAPERHRKIDKGEKAEVISLNDKPDKRR